MEHLTNEQTNMVDQSKEKGLDDYSFRDLFHFFINPEFHYEKFHLAKGSIKFHILFSMKFLCLSNRI